eukprot:Amastigsp_a1293_24.p3 type:complete len:106 gc:universal Amastigsp_a1293_24:729-412(-)
MATRESRAALEAALALALAGDVASLAAAPDAIICGERSRCRTRPHMRRSAVRGRATGAWCADTRTTNYESPSQQQGRLDTLSRRAFAAREKCTRGQTVARLALTS